MTLDVIVSCLVVLGLMDAVAFIVFDVGDWWICKEDIREVDTVLFGKYVLVGFLYNALTVVKIWDGVSDGVFEIVVSIVDDT